MMLLSCSDYIVLKQAQIKPELYASQTLKNPAGGREVGYFMGVYGVVQILSARREYACLGRLHDHL